MIMGIVNVTPDSFSDGGALFAAKDAVEAACGMVESGADIIDIGGESTRPGADPVSLQAELDRVIPVIEAISNRIEAPVSIDTYKAKVATEALSAGASIINDISGLRFDPDMPAVAAKSGAPIIVMHIKGTPGDMQQNPQYTDLLGEIASYLKGSVEIAKTKDVDEEQIIFDPGIGFGKTHAQNLTIIRELNRIKRIGRPILMGVSRKAFIGTYSGGRPVTDRLFGTAGAVAASVLYGADIVRVHDVEEMKQVTMIADAIKAAYD